MNQICLRVSQMTLDMIGGLKSVEYYGDKDDVVILISAGEFSKYVERCK